MAYLTAEEIEKAIGWWKREKAEAERLFRESLTHEQRELLKRRYRAERAIKTLRRWLKKAKEGKLRKRTLHVPPGRRRDYALLLMAKELRFPPSAAEALKEAAYRPNPCARENAKASLAKIPSARFFEIMCFPNPGNKTS